MSRCVCVCEKEREREREGERETLTGESKEKAHSLLKTLSPVLGTLMVGMYGTSSSPRSVAIFAFLLLAPQCCGASGAALTEERMLFLKLPVSTFLQPAGCDAEKHKNKMTDGWREAGCCCCCCCCTGLQGSEGHECCSFFSILVNKNTNGVFDLRRCYTAAVDCGDAACTRTEILYQKGPSHLWGWFIKPPTLTTACPPPLTHTHTHTHTHNASRNREKLDREVE